MQTVRSQPLPPRASAPPAQRGMGLFELLLVLGLLAVLAGLSVPSLAGALLKRQVQAAAEALVADLRLARSEAIKRAAVVAVCASSDGQACSTAAAWREGWIVFVDRDGNRRRDAGEDLLRTQDRPAGVATIASANPANDKSVFSYHPTGWAKAASQTLLFTPAGSLAAARVVCISSQGRPTLRPEGLIQCG